MNRWRLLIWAWVVVLVVLAYPCLAVFPPGHVRDAWFAAAVAALPLLRNLFKLPVATPLSARKMMHVEKDVLRRMGLVFGLALTLYLLGDMRLKEPFWAWLILFYLGMLAIEIGITLSAMETVDGPLKEPSSTNRP